MSNRLFTLNFSAQAQGDADGVHTVQLPVGCTLVGMSLCAEAFTGTPTGFNIDVQVGTTDIVTKVEANTAGTPGTWLSTHLGGANAPIAIAKDSVVSIDINLTGGTSPTADYDITLFLLAGTV